MNDNRNKRSICYVATTGKCLALFIWPQAKFLAEHGWQVTLVASEDKRLRKLADSQPNVRFIPFAMRRRASLIDAVKFPFKLFMLFRREKFNFVQYFMPNAAFYSATISSEDCATPPPEASSGSCSKFRILSHASVQPRWFASPGEILKWRSETACSRHVKG